MQRIEQHNGWAARRSRWAVGCALTVLIGLGASSGCSQRGDTFADLFTDEGDEWTILCMQFFGPDSQQDCEKVADTLRRSAGIDPEKVFARHQEGASRLYYGSYTRKPRPQRGTFSIPDVMRRDMKTIKNLGAPGVGQFFYDARAVPYPTPDVGNPAWVLSNNPGTYSLRVAVFYNEPGFYERKKAAALYCEELREKGYEAWYRHSERTSEVYVGTFAESDIQPVRRQGIWVNLNGPRVLALQGKETFKHELWNMRTPASKTGGVVVSRPSVLTKVRDKSEVEAGPIWPEDEF